MKVRAVLVLALSVIPGPLIATAHAATAGAAQEQTGSIRGTVVNTVGSALSAVAIEATSASGSVSRAITDRNGTYVLDGVPPGSYALSAQGNAVKRAVVEQVRVSAGRSVVVDFTLAPSAASEESRVVYAPGLVAASLDDATVFPADIVDRLPKGRDMLSLVPMAAGVSVDIIYSGLSYRGASAPENRYFIDGLDVTNLFRGGAALTLPTDVVQELQVRSGGLDVSIPAATGAVVSVVTPFASRQWRGTAGVHFTGDSLSGRQPPNGVGDPFTTWEPAVTAGGPLRGDRLSLFASYTPRFTSTTRTLATLTAQGVSSSAQFESSESTELSADNLSGRFGASHRFRLSAVFGRTRREGTLPPATGSAVVAGFDWGGLTRSQPLGAISGTVDLVPSSQFTLSIHIGYSRTDVIDYGVPEAVYRTGNAPGPATPPDVTAALNAVRSESAGIPTNAATDRDVQQRISGRASLGFRVRAAGEHALKAGLQTDWTSNDVLSGSFGPLITISATNRVAPYGTYQAYSWLLSGSASTTSFALFADDTWRPTARLTVRAGVRTERQPIAPYAGTLSDPSAPGPAVLTPKITLGFGDTLAPRIGAAFDVRGDGRWIASGTWGVTRDPVKLDVARYYLGADVRYQASYSLDTLDFSGIGIVGCVNPRQCRVLLPGTLLYSLPTFPLSAFAGNWQPTTGRDLGAGIDHAIGKTATLGVRYVHRRLVRAFEDVGYFATASIPVASLELATIGDAALSLGSGLPNAPSPRRNYDAVEARFSKRLAHGWQLDAAYTFSRLTGNYTAYFDPAAPAPALPYPPLHESPWSYTAAYNTPFTQFDQRGSAVYGPLDLDRPHVVKAQLLVDLPFRVLAGAYQTVASGMPISRWVSIDGQPVYYEGRLTDGRTPAYSQTDVRVQREFRIGERMRAQVGVDILNLFDQQGTIAVDAFQGAVTSFMTPQQFFAGFDARQLITSENPLFLQPSMWQPGRQVRFDVRVAF
jgi:hypothetical protein